jgi:hypothetical protein
LHDELLGYANAYKAGNSLRPEAGEYELNAEGIYRE